MKEDGRSFLRSQLLVVSLLSCVRGELVSGFAWVVLVLVWWFWREMLRFWRRDLDWKMKMKMGAGESLMAFSSHTPRGVSLREKKQDLMARSPINWSFPSGSRSCFSLSRLLSAMSRGFSGEGIMNSSGHEFVFQAGGGPSAARKILLVEDTEINRILLRKLFRDLNLLLEEAENGQIAVEYFKQGKNYDLVLMDKEMPVMDGHEATRQLRLLGVKTPIIALTGNSLQSDKEKFFQAGADEFQTKVVMAIGPSGRCAQEITGHYIPVLKRSVKVAMVIPLKMVAWNFLLYLFFVQPISRAELIQLLARYGLERPHQQ